ncbi:LysR family transcriptional regulator [Pseudoruegeria sp. SK021]|uniref:LysR family transcriptional regulator n=1 Tax=Pseudoruegeria sp. SK021 TaxID=1933035 RepID=UPI000A25204C|nr:LysR family transcriptional regulator [Pseudoruegeria sp. SK021]OSP54231.1 hypothetical protein BV911_13855 [Pseudoruegeria sp. SK021]
MNYAQIRAFTVVGQEGSVSRAADLLGVSQPTVSQHIKALEQRHGTRLVEKSGRGLVLTEAGTELLHVTKKLMAVADEVDTVLKKRPRVGDGRLRIVSDSPLLAVQIVSEMLTSHPDLDVTIRKDSVAGVVPALLDMRADVGIAVDPLIGSALTVQPIQREELHAALPARSPLAKRPVFAMDAAEGQTLIMREKGSRTRALIERALSLGNVTPARIIEVEGAEVVREAVAANMGVSFFACSECPPDPRIVYRDVSFGHGRVGFVENVIFRQDRRHVPEIAAFIAISQAMRQRVD